MIIFFDLLGSPSHARFTFTLIPQERQLAVRELLFFSSLPFLRLWQKAMFSFPHSDDSNLTQQGCKLFKPAELDGRVRAAICFFYAACFVIQALEIGGQKNLVIAAAHKVRNICVCIGKSVFVERDTHI